MIPGSVSRRCAATQLIGVASSATLMSVASASQSLTDSPDDTDAGYRKGRIRGRPTSRRSHTTAPAGIAEAPKPASALMLLSRWRKLPR